MARGLLQRLRPAAFGGLPAERSAAPTDGATGQEADKPALRASTAWPELEAAAAATHRVPVPGAPQPVTSASAQSAPPPAVSPVPSPVQPGRRARPGVAAPASARGRVGTAGSLSPGGAGSGTRPRRPPPAATTRPAFGAGSPAGAARRGMQSSSAAAADSKQPARTRPGSPPKPPQTLAQKQAAASARLSGGSSTVSPPRPAGIPARPSPAAIRAGVRGRGFSGTAAKASSVSGRSMMGGRQPAAPSRAGSRAGAVANPRLSSVIVAGAKAGSMDAGEWDRGSVVSISADSRAASEANFSDDPTGKGGRPAVVPTRPPITAAPITASSPQSSPVKGPFPQRPVAQQQQQRSVALQQLPKPAAVLRDSSVVAQGSPGLVQPAIAAPVRTQQLPTAQLNRPAERSAMFGPASLPQAASLSLPVKADSGVSQPAMSEHVQAPTQQAPATTAPVMSSQPAAATLLAIPQPRPTAPPPRPPPTGTHQPPVHARPSQGHPVATPVPARADAPSQTQPSPAAPSTQLTPGPASASQAAPTVPRDSSQPAPRMATSAAMATVSLPERAAAPIAVAAPPAASAFQKPPSQAPTRIPSQTSTHGCNSATSNSEVARSAFAQQRSSPERLRTSAEPSTQASTGTAAPATGPATPAQTAPLPLAPQLPPPRAQSPLRVAVQQIAVTKPPVPPLDISPTPDSDAVGGAKGPDTPEANAESPFAKGGPGAGTDSSSAATSNSASAAASLMAAAAKKVKQPPPGPKPKPKPKQPPPPPSRGLFGSCCAASSTVKEEAPAPRTDDSAKGVSQGGVRMGREETIVHGPPGTPGHSRHCTGSPSLSAVRPDSPVLSPKRPKATSQADVLANFSSATLPSTGPQEGERRRGHRRSSSAASVSSVGSHRSTASRRSAAAAVAAVSAMQVKGFEHIDPKAPPLRSALRRSGSSASVDSADSGRSTSRSALVPPGTVKVEEPSELTTPARRSGSGHLRRHRRSSSVNSLASLDSRGSVGSLCSLAEAAEAEDEAGGWSPAGTPQAARTPPSISSLDSASSLGSVASHGSARRPWRDIPAGMERPLSPLRRSSGDGDAFSSADSLTAGLPRSGSATWSASSSDLDAPTPPPRSASGAPARTGSSGSTRQPHRRRSSSPDFGAEGGSPLSPAAAAQRTPPPPPPPRPIAVASPSPDILNSGGSSGSVARSPGSQLQQMRHLREKVREIRAETERNLAAITAAAAEARARRSAQGASGGGPVDPLSPMSPRAAATDGARFQETKAKLQRRLEQLGMQQMRLEQHIAEAAQVPGASHHGSPASSRRSGHTSSANAMHRGNGGGLRGSGISPMPRPSQDQCEDNPEGEAGSPPQREGRRRVTFHSPSKAAPQPPLEDNTYIAVVDAVAGLRNMVGGATPATGASLLPRRSAASSRHSRSASSDGTSAAASSRGGARHGRVSSLDALGAPSPRRSGGSTTGSVASAVAAGYDGPGSRSGKKGPPPPLKPRTPLPSVATPRKDAPTAPPSSRHRHSGSTSSDVPGHRRSGSSRSDREAGYAHIPGVVPPGHRRSPSAGSASAARPAHDKSASGSVASPRRPVWDEDSTIASP